MKIKFTDKKVKVLTLAFLVLMFAARAIISLDPDFGWRLRTGFIILKYGIPKTDIYSYTMPSFPWVDHAWLTDVLMASVYSVFGKIGLGVLFSAIAVSSLVISISGQTNTSKWLNFWWRVKLKQQDIWFLGTPVFLLAISSIFTFSGIRAQVITWFIFALFLKLIFDRNLWKRFRAFIPLLFWVWANFHGGFIAGLGVFWVVFVVRSFFRKKVEGTEILILLTSTLLTFINPYGWGVYREVWSSVSDSSLRFEILEWQPAFMSFDIPSLIFVVLSTVFVTTYKKVFAVEELIVFYLVLFEGVSSIRHFPLFIIVATPMTITAIRNFYESIQKNKLSVKRFLDMYSYFWLFCFLVSVTEVALSFKGAVYLSEESFYPRDALVYIKNNVKDGNIFSDYAWGGYLIWQLPEKKVFLDGRMPSWSWQEAPPGESNNAMKDYLNIIKGKEDYNEYFDKYGISWVLLPVEKPTGLVGAMEKIFTNKFNFLYKLFNIDETNFSLVEKIKSDGWKKVYEDKIALIYSKPS
jgi:hypothetical protein